MKQSLRTSLAGSLLGLGLTITCGVAAAYAADVPNYNDLYNQTQSDAHAQVNAQLAANPTPTPITITNPTVTPTPSASSSQDSGTVPADANVIVLNTGDNAKIDTSNNQSSNTTVTNNNDANVSQSVNGSANTGGNTANRNISYGGNAGDIQTGNASVNSNLGTSVNSNTTRISGTCPDLKSNTTVYNTGDNVSQNSSVNSTCSTTVTNNNNAVITQSVNGSATTGNNQAERNISFGGNAGQILTGNANVGTVMTAQGNQNVVIVGGDSNHGTAGSGANIYILNTGDGAVLYEPRRSTTSVNVVNNNTFNSNQSVNATADTGNNTASRNINQNGDAGVIQTGDATVNTVLGAQANSNNTVISGSGGSATNNVNIVNTGDNLKSNDQTSVNNSTTVTNNNNAVINQVVDASANTGNNHADRNIAVNGDAGVIQTGNASVNTVLGAEANQNHTVISGDQGTATTNLNLTNTGDNTQVDASSHAYNSAVVTNNNNAEVNQVVNVDANTGGNSANRNIGGGSITTGNVTVNTQAVANVNGNWTFVVNSATTPEELFNQLFQSLFGASLPEVVANQSAQPSNNIDVTNTGDNGKVLAQNTTTRRVVVANNNVSNINQAVNVSANTGNNTCNRNVGGCDIVTGNATVNTMLIANANLSWTIIGNISLPVGGVTNPQPDNGSSNNQDSAVEATQASAPVATSNPSVLGASALGSVTQLPETGSNAGLFGLLLLGAGLMLRLKLNHASK